MQHKYHIGDQVIFIDNQSRPTLDEIIDIDARINNDGLSTLYLLTNGRHYQESELHPSQKAAKSFSFKHFKKLKTRFDEAVMA
ncbi:hypothetical protein [Spirosoma aerophilum]